MSAIKYITPILSLFLVACQTTGRLQPVESKQALSEMLAEPSKPNKVLTPPPPMPDQVQRELVSSHLLDGYNTPLPSERRFDVSANDVDASIFFASLVQGSPLSVVIHPGVQGSITLALKQVTLTEVLQVVEDMYGFDINLEGNILRVYPAGMRTETFPLNYLYMKRQGISVTSISSGRITDSGSNSSGSSGNSSNNSETDGGNSSNSTNSGGNETNGTFIQSKTETDFWGQLQQTLISIIGQVGGGRQVVVSPQAGLVTVRAYPNELRQVRNFLKIAENHLQRQVILEAKIMEVTLSDGYQQGIEWSKLESDPSISGHNINISGGTSGGNALGDEIANVLGGITSLTVAGKDFAAMVNLLSTQGDVDVLSSPRVTATNNQKAVIKVGRDEYFVTNVSSTTVASSTPVTTPDVELTPFFSGIALDVTPQIDKKGNVLLHIHPSVIDVKQQTKKITISDNVLELPLAESEIRESDTVIRAKSGEVVVIGGLMKTDNQEIISKVPILGDIPILGELFKNRKRHKKKTELVILLKPTVVGRDTWRLELERTRSLLDRWYSNGDHKPTEKEQQQKSANQSY